MSRQPLADELSDLQQAHLLRRPAELQRIQDPAVIVDGHPAINFCSNNYLGLADDPLLVDAAVAAMRTDGFGAGSARLVAGNLTSHRALERAVANWTRSDAALLFNSGYHANLGLVSALVGPEDAVFSDALNHASFIDGCRLSRARVVIFRHADASDLDQQLRATGPVRRRLVITDSLFSMDGDRAPLRALLAVARAHDAWLAVDDAHAVGVLGDRGAGLAAGLGVDLQMGTFGKALGGFGAYVAAARPFIDLLINRARTFIFTTALPVPIAAAACAAVDWIGSDHGRQRRARLADRVALFHRELRARGFNPAAEPSHIVPLRVKEGDPSRALALTQALLARGIFAQAIRPPTVPEATSRLRLTLMALHTDDHLACALDALTALRCEFE